MARKYMNLAEVIEAVRTHRPIDKVKFNPDWEIELAGVQGNKNKGYALEFLINAYCMTSQFNGEHWVPIDEGTMQPLASYSSIRLGMRGKTGQHSPDSLLQNKKTKDFLLISCKYSKTSWGGGDGRSLVDFNKYSLGDKSSTKFGLMSEAPYLITGNPNTVKANLVRFSTLINHNTAAVMWNRLCESLALHGNSFKQLENTKRIVLEPKDQVQDYLMTEIESKFNKNHKKVWLNAVMRSGKSYVFAMLASKLTATNKTENRVALISHFPTDTFRQWKEIFVSARQYEDYDLFCSADNEVDDLGQLKSSKKHVLIVSAQAIKADPDKWRKYFKNHAYNFVGLDEVHYGYDTPDVQDVINMIDCKKWLLMSGTIDKLKSRGLVDDDAVVEWTYMDNQLCKNGHNDKLGKANASDDFYAKFTEADYPTLNIVHAKPNKVLVNKVSSLGNADDIQTWDKIYENPGQLRSYVSLLLGGSYVCKRDELVKAFGPAGSTPVDRATGHKMIAWYCPGKKAQYALKAAAEEFYENNPSVPRRITKLFNSTEEEDGQFKDELRKLESDDKEYLFILCGQGTTGITYKDMPVIIIGRDCSSITTWLQICFRPMSPMKTPTKRYVFDLSFGHVFTDNIRGLLDNNCINHADTKRSEEFFNCVNITDGYDRWDFDKFQTEFRENMLSSPDKLMKSAISSLDIKLGDVIDISDVDLSTPKSGLEASIGEVVKGKTKLALKKTKKNKGEIDEEKELMEQLEQDRNFQLLLLKVLMKTAIVNGDI